MARRKKEREDTYKRWNVALYIRLSREDGNDVSYSVVNQQQKLTRYVEEQEEDLNIVDVFVDDGYTGTDSIRESFQRMLSCIEDGIINCVIVKDLSRLSRNYIESGQYLEYYFVKKNVRFISLELPTLDSYKYPEGMNSIMVPIQSVFNDNFARETSQKIRSTFNSKRKNGDFIGSFAPYGYKKDSENKGKLVIDEEVASVIRDIFRWFLDGQGKTGIAKRLNDLGVPNPSTYKKMNGHKYKNPHDKFEMSLWSARTIDSILHNQVYIGDMVQGRQRILSYKVHKQIETPKEEWFIVPDTHEAIISIDDFKMAQELLKRDTRTVSSRKEPYLFAGLIRCADCKKAMHRKAGKKNAYYVCRTYKQSSTACTSHTIGEKTLESAVLDAVNIQLGIVRDLDSVMSEIQNSQITQNTYDTLDKAITTKSQEIDKVNRIRDGLYSDWKNEIISRDDYLRMKQNYDLQLEKLKNSLRELREEATTLENTVKSGAGYFEQYRKYERVDRLERSFVVEFIDSIFVKEDKSIHVKFRFEDQFRKLCEMLEPQKKLARGKNDYGHRKNDITN